jgi:DNA-binding beta-propeller fold protein YncE
MAPLAAMNLSSFSLLLFSLPLIFSVDYSTQIIAGTGDVGNGNGNGLYATFNHPFGCAIAPDNSYGLIADSGNGELRKVTLNAGLQTATVSSLANIPNIYSVCFTNSQTAWVTNIGTVQRIDLSTMTNTIVASSIDLAALACSHDGTKVLITTYRGAPNNISRPLYILDSTTTSRVNLTKFAEFPADCLGITFAPDDSFVLATTFSNSLYKVTLSTGLVTMLTLSRQLNTPLGIAWMNNDYLIAEGGSGITSYNLETNTLGATIPLPDSYGICTSPDNSYGFVSLYQKSKIALLTYSMYAPTLAPTSFTAATNFTFSILAGSGVAGSHDDVGLAATLNQPWGCAVSNDNSFGLIADTGNKQLRKYTFATGAVTTWLSNLRVGFIAMDRMDNSLAYFTSPVGLHRFDLATLTPSTIATVGSLAALAVAPNNQFLLTVTYIGSNIDATPRVVYRLDLTNEGQTLENLLTIPFDSLGVTISYDSASAYVSALYEGTVSRIDLATKTLTTLIMSRTLSGPTGLSMDGSYLLVTEYLGAGISRYDLVTKELEYLTLVSQANAICLSSDTSIGLVSLLNDNKIGGLFSTSPTVFSSVPTFQPTRAPTANKITSPPTPLIVNRPAHNYSFSIIAGSGVAGSHDDVGLAATLNQPWGCAISTDNSFGLIADTGNKQLRKLTIGSAIVQSTSQTNIQIGFVCIASAQEAYFTSNLGIHSLVLNTMTSTLLASASMLGAIACSPDKQFLLATTYRGITSDLTPRSLYKLSMSGGSADLEVLMSFAFDSLGVVVADDSLIAYVTSLSEGSIYRIDLAKKTMVALTLPRTLSGPTGVAFAEFGSYLMVTEYLGTGVSRYNLVTKELVKVAVVSQPNAICMSSDSSIGLVSLLGSNKIGFLERQSNGNDLAPGQCCTPGKNDHYCSYNGVCDATGTSCICTDPLHYSSSDRCMNYYSSGLPDTCPPLQFPYIPTQRPTAAPSFPPTRPPSPIVCTPGDRSYCTNLGTCNSRGDACVCDDQTHYWSSEKCKTRHTGPQLAAGQFCSPNSVDAYCSYMGTCNGDGSECECFDSVHRLGEERCQTWHEIPDAVCRPYDRTYCSNRGACASTGDGCVCDDQQHYWASERCSKSHPGPELASSSQCCSPGEVDTYCNYMGRCNAQGTKCLCFDPTHRLSSERCLNYYQTLTSEQLQDNNSTGGSDGTCPGFLSESSNNNGGSSNGQKNDTLSIILIAIGSVVGVAFAVVIVFFFVQSKGPPSPETPYSNKNDDPIVKKESMKWYEENPIQLAPLPRSNSTGSTSSKNPRRKSSLNPFALRSESYQEISDVTMPSEMHEEEALGGTDAF